MATDLQAILQLRVPIIVLIGERRTCTNDVLSLGPGAIIELERSSEDELDLMVNNQAIGTGVAVKIGENFGIRIARIKPPEQRIEAMAAGG